MPKIKRPEAYDAWRSMKKRCNRDANHNYPLYGGRGISVCDSWMDSYSNFIKDMGPKPNKNSQIDRIDNDGDYTPENTRWSTPADNSRNTRANQLSRQLVRVCYHMTTEIGLSVPIICEFLGLNQHTLRDALYGRSWAGVLSTEEVNRVKHSSEARRSLWSTRNKPTEDIRLDPIDFNEGDK